MEQEEEEEEDPVWKQIGVCRRLAPRPYNIDVYGKDEGD